MNNKNVDSLRKYKNFNNYLFEKSRKIEILFYLQNTVLCLKMFLINKKPRGNLGVKATYIIFYDKNDDIDNYDNIICLILH